MTFQQYIRSDRRHSIAIEGPYVRLQAKSKQIIIPRSTLSLLGIDPDLTETRIDLFYDPASGELACVVSENGALSLSRIGYVGRSEGVVAIRGLMNKYGFREKSTGNIVAEIRDWFSGQKAVVFNPGFRK